MAEPAVHKVSEEQAIDSIVETVQMADAGTAPFALVLGSGFSWGLVPTAEELVREHLPIWIHSRKGGRSYADYKGLPLDRRTELAAAFWRKFVERNGVGDSLVLDERGLPVDHAVAYKEAFNDRRDGALGKPADARRFQRELMRLDKPRLNAAHFFLASIMGAQRMSGTLTNASRYRAAFSRLILTTNFDPFLQTALQLVGCLYYMSDRPGLQETDLAFEDTGNAIHIVYVHGSVHRPLQIASERDIQELRKANARQLGNVVQRHGVIVLGYSGWDDAIVEALATCDRFDHGLYWCGREPDPLKEGAFGKRVPEILRKNSAKYVQINGAGTFMAQLSQRLLETLPPLLDDPIEQLHWLLEAVDLDELESLHVSGAGVRSEASGQVASGADGTFTEAKRRTLLGLQRARSAFRGEAAAAANERLPAREALATEAVDVEDQARHVAQKLEALQRSIAVAEAVGHHQAIVEASSDALRLKGLEPNVIAELLIKRGVAYYFGGQREHALRDWSELIELPNAPVLYVAAALNNRGVVYGESNDDAELLQYTRVIESLPGAPVEQVAKALLNRGLTYGRRGDDARELQDYTRVIESLPGAPVEQIAKALLNRGAVYSSQGEIGRALADNTRVIESLPGAPADLIARALVNRGIVYRDRGEKSRALEEFVRVIESLPDAPVDAVAQALIGRGVACDQSEQALEDFTRVIESLSGVPVEQVAQALVHRGAQRAQRGEKDLGIEDFTRVIESLPDAPSKHVAAALVNRGWCRYGAGDYAGFLADTAAALAKEPSSLAALNYSFALLAIGRDTDALQSYRSAAARYPDAVDDALDDLHTAIGKWLSAERAQPMISLLESFRGPAPAA